MRSYTRRGALRLFGAGVVIIAGLGLAGCGGVGGGIKNASEPIPASQAFSQAAVWMQCDGDDQIGKGTEVERFLAFDGAGNVTVYQCDGVTFADLDGLSDDEVLDLARQQDQAVFEAQRQKAIERVDEAIKAWQECYDTMKAEADAGTYDTINYYGAHGIDAVPEEERAEAIQQFDATLENIQDSLKAAEEGQSFNEAAEYQEPEPQPYTLALETDGSGNIAAGEELRFTAPRFDFYQISIDEDAKSDMVSDKTRFRIINDLGWHNEAEIPKSVFGSKDDDIELYASNYSTTSTVYDTTFSGYADLVTFVNEGHAGFTWDTPDTKGIEVD